MKRELIESEIDKTKGQLDRGREENYDLERE